MSGMRAGSESVESPAAVEGTADLDDFGGWLSPHLDSMRLLAARLDLEEPDDLVQEAIIQAWRKWRLYDSARGTPRTWLLSVLVGCDRTRRRRKRWRLHSSAEQRGSSVVDTTAASAQRPSVRAAVDTLPTRQRLAVACFYYLDLSVEETAKVLRCAPGTVKSNLSVARRTLRTLLQSAEDGHAHE